MKFLAVVIVACASGFVEPHGYLKIPVARTSIQLEPGFGTEQPYWWDHQGVYCSNVKQDLSYSKCGRCGEALGNSDASQGGIYDKGVIVANYTAGSQIEVTIKLKAPHHGSWEIELCPQKQETDNCFQQLQILSATTSMKNGRVCVGGNREENGGEENSATVQLPVGVKCSRCTLRWTYRTSYPGAPDWDSCWNPKLTQTFRNCADISIN